MISLSLALISSFAFAHNDKKQQNEQFRQIQQNNIRQMIQTQRQAIQNSTTALNNIKNKIELLNQKIQYTRENIIKLEEKIEETKKSNEGKSLNKEETEYEKNLVDKLLKSEDILKKLKKDQEDFSKSCEEVSQMIDLLRNQLTQLEALLI